LRTADGKQHGPIWIKSCQKGERKRPDFARPLTFVFPAARIDVRAIGKDFDLSYAQSFDVGSRDSKDLAVFEGSDASVSIPIVAVDWVACDWSERIVKLEGGEIKPATAGELLAQGCRFLSAGEALEGDLRRTGLGRNFFRSLGFTLGIALGNAKESDGTQVAAVFTHIGPFFEVMSGVGIEGGWAYAATPGTIVGSEDRDDSGLYVGLRVDPKELFFGLKRLRNKR